MIDGVGMWLKVLDKVRIDRGRWDRNAVESFR